MIYLTVLAATVIGDHSAMAPNIVAVELSVAMQIRRMGLGILVAMAITCCVLIAGTPVNNDPSPAAEVAGIHLATPVGQHQVALAAAVLGLVAAVAARLRAGADGVLVREPERPDVRLVRAVQGRNLARRGPPALASRA